ncbi:MAG: hypothetical protein JST92_16335 [Deltaproteobacteria bacterium]|nr:hypothetical protein [Deltaproteobacteria bacterium]
MMLALVAVLLAAAPDWVATGGVSPRYPKEKFVVGFGVVQAGPDALPAARNQASADLSTRILVRIENQFTDVQSQKNDKFEQEMVALTKSSSDVKLSDLSFETHQDADKVYALAYVERGPAAAKEKAAAQEAMARALQLMEQADGAAAKKREGDALKAYLAVRVAANEVSFHETLERAFQGSATTHEDLAGLERKAEEKVQELLKKPVSTVKDAAQALVAQLDRQGAIAGTRYTVAPFTYRGTAFSSSFSRAFAQDLEVSATAAGASGARGLALRGTYFDEGDLLRIKALATEVESGKLIAAAEVSLPKKAVPKELALVPQNVMEALKDDKVLAGADEVVTGELHLDLTTNLGRRNLLVSPDQDIKVMLRANKACYVRLVYWLASGQRTVLEQGYFLDDSKRNLWVEYPATFQASAPFGVERFQAVAFAKKPEPLPTKKMLVDGEEYEIVSDESPQALVKHRGMHIKKATETESNEMAESVLTLTTAK